MSTLADFPTATRKKPLPAAIRDGRQFWRRQLRNRVAALEAAIAAGDEEGATKLLRRARVCEQALRGWDSVERQAAQGIAS